MNKRRLLSFFVALCMIVAIIPAGIAPASAEGAEVYPTVINFTNGGADGAVSLWANTPGDVPAYATFDGFGYELAIGVNNQDLAYAHVRTVTAMPNYVAIQTASADHFAALKIKVPAGTYRVFMKTPSASVPAGVDGKIRFKIGGYMGVKGWDYSGGDAIQELGDYDFVGGMNKLHMFENIVTLPETEDNIHTLAVYNNSTNWSWAAIEALYFVPVDVINAKFSHDPDNTYGTAWHSLGGPISLDWAGNYVNQLSYANSGLVWSASTGNVNRWLTTSDSFRFVLSTVPTTITYNILVPQDGTYKVDFISGYNNRDYGTLYLKIADTLVGSYDFSDESAPLTKAMEDIELTAGVTTVTLYTGDVPVGWAVAPGAVKLTYVEDEEPEEVVIPDSDIFGNTYAYVKDGKVYFIGGLKTIEGYSSVGFEVWVNGNKVDDITTDKVYTSFTVAGQTVNASDWASQYVFITEKSVSAGDAVKIKPYIAKGEVKTYHADAFTLELTM